MRLARLKVKLNMPGRPDVKEEVIFVSPDKVLLREDGSLIIIGDKNYFELSMPVNDAVNEINGSFKTFK